MYKGTAQPSTGSTAHTLRRSEQGRHREPEDNEEGDGHEPCVTRHRMAWRSLGELPRRRPRLGGLVSTRLTPRPPPPTLNAKVCSLGRQPVR